MRAAGTAILAGGALALAGLGCTGGGHPDESGAAQSGNEALLVGPLEWVDADPDWSPDGRRIVFTRGSTSNVGDEFNLRWVEVATGLEQSLTSGAGHRDRDPAWSPDGQTIVFVRSLDSLFCNEDDAIYLVGADGESLRSLGYKGCDPSWSPDGSKIAFLGADGLYVIGAEGGDPRVVVPNLPQEEREGVFVPGVVFAFDWSPDGTRFAFERQNEIWVVDADGDGRRRLTRAGYARVAHGPRWSPDGGLVLHERYDHGDEGLWVMGPDGNNPRKLADGEIYELDWSPDGGRVVFGRTGGEGGLFVVAVSGDGERPLGLWGDSFGGWAADGKRIAVGGSTAGTLSPDPYPIVVVDVDTGRAVRATQRATAGGD